MTEKEEALVELLKAMLKTFHSIISTLDTIDERLNKLEAHDSARFDQAWYGDFA